MIVGNRNSGKKVCTALLTVLLVMIVITVVVTWRKKSAPLPQPPLHPSLLFTTKSIVAATRPSALAAGTGRYFPKLR